MTAEEPLNKRAHTVLMGTYTRYPLNIVSGHGVWVVDDQGRELVDLVAGIAVDLLGHAHPAMVRALREQAATLVHTSNLYYTEPQVLLAERLIATAFPGRVFFCNSGTEANEGAIKLARKWGRTQRGGATRIITMENAFHGRTLGALAATGSVRYREPFEPLPIGFTRVRYNDAQAVADAVDETTCAVMLEPVQGESGIHPLDPGVLGDLRRICDERDLLLILDEVQTGMGRTGTWWAYQHEGVLPDILTCAKGLGGGLPIGAILAAPRADVFEPGDHGCTFGGNPLCCAVALAVLQAIEDEGLVHNAAIAGEQLRKGLSMIAADAGIIEEVRGRGLMLAAQLREPIAMDLVRRAIDAGVLVNHIGDSVLRMVPPLIISRTEIDEAVLRLEQAFSPATAGVRA
ncbi:MAG TPA: acetylornithine transaminase [Candidatus Dormibacteraeota bacterium]|nr:acetylornithine transaminase [Candidatus Dormibacteraeota bacterium]